MKNYTIGEVSKLLKLKAHAIRYWEKEFSFLSPKKSPSGRRVYKEVDLHMLFRLKYLLYVKRYTIEGARKKIWDEISSPKIDIKIRIHEIRSIILKLLALFEGKNKAKN